KRKDRRRGTPKIFFFIFLVFAFPAPFLSSLVFSSSSLSFGFSRRKKKTKEQRKKESSPSRETCIVGLLFREEKKILRDIRKPFVLFSSPLHLVPVSFLSLVKCFFCAYLAK
ncbi:hypothetical protein CSUI_004842, partial [Cystoisospora suis]